jgi:Gpi18-like mannosyltransferase
MDRENQLQKYLFFIILVLKIIFAFSAGSYFLNKLFTPFINWFVISHFQNPWQYFYQLDMLKMFPYPTVMLWIMAVPRLLFSPWLSDQWQSVTPLHLGVMRLPLLAADLALFLILKKLVRNHKKLFWVYWCSPIIFFVNYLYGQLDIIPTAIFMGALYFVLNRKFLTGLLLVAVAAAAKTHILIALPFLIIFIYKQKVRLWQLAGLLVAFLSAYLALLWPYLHSPAFIQMVFIFPMILKVNLERILKRVIKRLLLSIQTQRNTLKLYLIQITLQCCGSLLWNWKKKTAF